MADNGFLHAVGVTSEPYLVTYEADPVAIGARIHQARTEAGILNASKFARGIGVQPQSVYRYERGEQAPASEVLVRIAKLTRRSMEWLMCGESESASKALATWLQTPTGASAAPHEIEWLGRVDLDGNVPSNTFFDLLLSAHRHGLAPEDARKSATIGRAVRED